MNLKEAYEPIKSEPVLRCGDRVTRSDVYNTYIVAQTLCYSGQISAVSLMDGKSPTPVAAFVNNIHDISEEEAKKIFYGIDLGNLFLQDNPDESLKVRNTIASNGQKRIIRIGDRLKIAGPGVTTEYLIGIDPRRQNNIILIDLPHNRQISVTVPVLNITNISREEMVSLLNSPFLENWEVVETILLGSK